ncbi:MAG: hypothetical protein HQL37_06940 [Alphaproteobacteria bacterium]|nr:hypothetical protein [Alphaproteobacteria bacterium]
MNRHARRATRKHQPTAAATLVLSHEGLSLAEATVPGRMAVMLPVPAGAALATFRDPRIGTYVEAGAAVILTFGRIADAAEFQRLMDAARTNPPPPAPTHAAPVMAQ